MKLREYEQPIAVPGTRFPGTRSQPYSTYIYYSTHSPRGFSVADYIKYLSYLLSLTIFS